MKTNEDMKASELREGVCYKTPLRVFVIKRLETNSNGKIVITPCGVWHMSNLYGIIPVKPKEEVYDKDAETDFEEFPMDSFNKIVDIQEKANAQANKIMRIAKTACLAILNDKTNYGKESINRPPAG